MNTLAILTAGFLLAANQYAQAPVSTSAPDYRAVVKQAETLIDEGRAAEALTRLQSVRCPANDARCEANIRFARAYAWDVRSASNPDPGLARRALLSYQSVLEYSPEDPKALVNIARMYARLGESMEAARTFERAARAWPSRKAPYLLAAAESLRDSEYESAARLYRLAAEAGSPEAWSGLVSLRLSGLGQADANERKTRLAELLTLARDLRTRNANGPALEALEGIMRATHADDPVLAGNALAEWVEIQASNGTLSTSALELLPDPRAWKSPVLQTLRDSIVSGSWRFGPEWEREPQRYAALAAAKAIGDTLMASEKDADRAAALYDRVMNATQWQQSREKPDLFLGAATQLARLYVTRGRDNDLRALEGRLFEIKGGAYESHDLAAMQRMHAVLGTIYDERGIWTSSNPARNATFQYSRLVRVAKEREAKEGIFQPLPHYAAKAAEGLRRAGKTREARELEIEAASGYLELDALEEAQRAITRASSGGAEDDARVVALRRIATYRAAIPELATTRELTLPAWSTVGGPLDPDFVARQEFRALSDLAARAKEKNESEEADALNLRAFDNALRQETLTGTGDALRLEQIRESVEETPRLPDKKSPASAAEPATEPQKPHVWTVKQAGAPEAKVVWPAPVVENAREAATAIKKKPKPPV